MQLERSLWETENLQTMLNFISEANKPIFQSLKKMKIVLEFINSASLSYYDT